MNEYICFLITLFYTSDQSLIKCALKIKRYELPQGCIDYPLEERSKEMLHEKLPLHVRSIGPIVAVEQIFEVESKYNDHKLKIIIERVLEDTPDEIWLEKDMDKHSPSALRVELEQILEELE